MSAFGHRDRSGSRIYPKAGGGGERAHEARNEGRHGVGHQDHKYRGRKSSSGIQIDVCILSLAESYNLGEREFMM